MARNVEIKARIASIEALLPLARALADSPPELIAQVDTFFACAQSRLKLRAFADGHGELIACARPDSAGPKTSGYLITPTDEPYALRATLGRALGIPRCVKKMRTLLLVARTRVHLDRVERLGNYLELGVTNAFSTPTSFRVSRFERERRPEARPIGIGPGRRRDHVNGLHQPHATAAQRQPHPAFTVGAGREPFGGVQAVHGNDQRPRQRPVFISQPHRKVLTRAQRIRVPFGHQLERKAERTITLPFGGRP